MNPNQGTSREVAERAERADGIAPTALHAQIPAFLPRRSERVRFTRDGSEALEQHLAQTCTRITRAVRRSIPARSLEALLLGGGYGRGEGGVLRDATGDQPYNDLECYVFVRGNDLLVERRFGQALRELSRSLSPAAGLELEFKVLTAAKLRRSEVSMFFHDLVMGHRLLAGSPEVLQGCAHHRDAGAIPLHEATRLLMNRASGLLFSAERLQRPTFTPADADFVGRNLAKAQLALGDVVLTAYGRYHWSCLERQARLQSFTTPALARSLEAIRAHHRNGVAFKLHPRRSAEPRDALARQHAGLSSLAHDLWLWLEGTRLGTTFRDGAHYALSPIDKRPETPSWRNRLVNARSLGLLAALGPGASRHPRQRLMHALCLLLWAPHAMQNPSQLRRLQDELLCAATDLPGLVTAYENLWHRFN